MILTAMMSLTARIEAKSGLGSGQKAALDLVQAHLKGREWLGEPRITYE